HRHCRGSSDGTGRGSRHRRAGGLRRVAPAAAADVPGHYRSVAHLLRGESLHIRHGPPADRHAAGPRIRRPGRSGALCRSGSAGAGSDRDRHRLRDHRAVPGGSAGLARAHRNGSRRRPRAGDVMTGWSSHLTVVPILLPLLAGAAMLFFDERRRAVKAAISLTAVAALAATAVWLLDAAATAGADGPLSVYRIGDWPAPFS